MISDILSFINTGLLAYLIYLLWQIAKQLSKENQTSITSIFSSEQTQFIEPTDFEEKVKKSRDLDNLM